MDYLQQTVSIIAQDYFEKSLSYTLASFSTIYGEKDVGLVEKYKTFCETKMSKKRRKPAFQGKIYTLLKYYGNFLGEQDFGTQVFPTLGLALNSMYDELIDSLDCHIFGNKKFLADETDAHSTGVYECSNMAFEVRCFGDFLENSWRLEIHDV